MRATPPPSPLFERFPPATRVALAWGAGTVFTFLMRVRLPGEQGPAVYPGVLLYRWDGLTYFVLATGLTLFGGLLLERRPLPALALLLAGSAGASLSLSVGEIPMAQFLAVDVAVYFIASTGPRRTARLATGTALGVLAGYLAVRLLKGWAVGMSAELAVALTAVIAHLLGASARTAREHAERVRAEAEARALTRERLRIARELHDMVAHTIGVIALQAGAAARVIDTRPEQAREALGAIETAGRETLAGLRRMLGALRRPEPGPRPHDGREHAPEPEPGLGLADVTRLAETTTAAGVRVDLCLKGEPRPLPPEIDVSAYRIIQEAVTNVVRHSGTSSCRVSIDHRADALSIEVLDDGRGPGRAAVGGFGILGMRERVGLLRGEFSAAPRPEGGFRVAARLPVPVEAR